MLNFLTLGGVTDKYKYYCDTKIIFPQSQMGPYETSSGVTPLHIAVVNQNINLVQQLVSRGADVATPRVTGLYFRKRIGGLIYYGSSAGPPVTSINAHS